ncbi:unnamed protein product [Amoebophrya sp. A120]|nr:unnamed protein product [Amoebophrya sp. A120]|eukprot:GSA120T00024886001.1
MQSYLYLFTTRILLNRFFVDGFTFGEKASYFFNDSEIDGGQVLCRRRGQKPYITNACHRHTTAALMAKYTYLQHAMSFDKINSTKANVMCSVLFKPVALHAAFAHDSYLLHYDIDGQGALT